MKKLLVIKQKGTTLTLSVIENSEIIKNCVPILWFNDGIYGWIPVEVVKNEISVHQDIARGIRSLDSNCAIPIFALRFNWTQIQPLSNEIGKILMSFAEE